MSTTTNYIIAFLGGVTVGSVITAGILKKFGYSTRFFQEKDGNNLNAQTDDAKFEEDKPSYSEKKEVNTHRRNYSNVFLKPNLEEVAKKYNNQDFEKEMVAREHPEDDEPEDGDEDEELEIGEASSYHFSPDDLELEEIDGYGHVICELYSTKPSSLIYLISNEYIGEIYPVEALTYYERDNVLCDENNSVVNDISAVVADALEHFGDHSGDSNTVYIRNCSIGIEYEVTRVDGYYAAKIYGIKDEDFEGGAMAQISRKSRKKHAKATEDDNP